MCTISEFRTNFLLKLLLLFRSLEKDCRDEAQKLILAKYLEFFHKDFLDESGVSDVSAFLEDSSNYTHTLNHFFLDTADKPIDLQVNRGNFSDGTYYTTIAEVKSQIDKLVKDLDSQIATATDKS